MEHTLGKRLWEGDLDPLIDQLCHAIEQIQKGIVGVKAPHPGLKEEYASALKRLADIRGTPLYYPYLGSGIGKGPLVELLDGSIKYDMINGIGPYFFGHSHPRLTKAVLRGALSDTIMQGNLQQTGISLEVMEAFVNLSGLDHCFLTTSGAMALENGFKMAFQKRKGAYRVLAFQGCFSGRTLTMSQVTDKPQFREGLPPLLHVDYLPFPENQDPTEALKLLETYLKRYPQEHALLVAELIQGEGGFRVGSKEFFTPIFERLQKEGVPILFDEVQTFGRLEKPFAFQAYGFESFADIVTIGKLSNVCATLFKDKMKPKGGLLSQTFTGATSTLFAGLETLKMFQELPIFGPDGMNAQVFKWCEKEIKRLKLQGPFGRGSMVAFVPGKGEEEEAKQFLQRLFEKGVIAFAAGAYPTKVRMLLPAPVLEEKDIQKVFQIIEEAL